MPRDRLAAAAAEIDDLEYAAFSTTDGSFFGARSVSLRLRDPCVAQATAFCETRKKSCERIKNRIDPLKMYVLFAQ